MRHQPNDVTHNKFRVFIYLPVIRRSTWNNQQSVLSYVSSHNFKYKYLWT